MNDSRSCLVHVEDTEFQLEGVTWAISQSVPARSYLKFQFKGRAATGKGQVMAWMTSGLTRPPASSQAPWICDWFTSLSFLRYQVAQSAET